MTTRHDAQRLISSLSLELDDGSDSFETLEPTRALRTQGVGPFRRVGPVEVLVLGRAAARALLEAHTRGDVHGAIDPGALREEGETCTIEGWGRAAAVAERARTSIADLGALAGYVAPELARGEAPSQAADVFALGAVLFERLTGEAPYAANSAEASAELASEGRHPPLAAFCPDAPELLTDVIQSMICPEVGLRPDIGSVLTALTLVADELTGRESSEHEAPVAVDGNSLHNAPTAIEGAGRMPRTQPCVMYPRASAPPSDSSPPLDPAPRRRRLRRLLFFAAGAGATTGILAVVGVVA